MSNVIGIGARPLRKEDQRFLTGRGNYVADIKRPDMVAACSCARRMRTPRSNRSTPARRWQCLGCSASSPAKI
jgi:CO/xanthine dehydrogenase Mo-binding subunit